ncbi:MAG: M24 family metallopeptidase [Microthrixaceae bacterium]|nr:M24 family metallopeptidase [Microthrixaceae bacterium]
MAKLGRRVVLPPPPSEPVEPGVVGPLRTVPVSIRRPDYAATGEPAGRVSAPVRTTSELAAMRIAGRVAAEALLEVGRHVKPGVTTDELDHIGHDALVTAGAYPSTLNYRGFPKSLCTSVNEVVCHGIPDSRRLADGDIVNVDITAYIDGVHGDTSATFLVGEVDDGSKRLVATARAAMHEGIATVRPGSRIHDIGKAIGVGRGASGLLRRTRVHRTRHRRPVPHQPASAALLRPAPRYRVDRRHDLHDRADDQPGNQPHQDVERRMDRRHARPATFGPVRTHRPRHPNRP